MRVNIKTKTPVKDRDIKALYLIREAMEMSSERMREANLRFALHKFGFDVFNLPKKIK